MKPYHLLLIEDNEGDIMLITEALETSDHVKKISVIKTGLEATDFLDRKSENKAALPDIILLDINLPYKNGHEVLQYIKCKEELKHIPVIMLTTSSSEKDILLSYKNKANCFITKPVDIEGFYEIIQGIEKVWLEINTPPKKPE